MPHFVEVQSLEETFTLGRRLGALLFPGAVVALEGGLGAGKTHFVRAVAEGLDIPDSRVVSSPTFVLIQEYAARLPIYHFDAYRLARVDDFSDLGAHEYFQGDGVCLVEWADKIAPTLPLEKLWIRIEIIGPTARRYTFAATGDRHAKILAALFPS